jgi:hypothetical protein
MIDDETPVGFNLHTQKLHCLMAIGKEGKA